MEDSIIEQMRHADEMQNNVNYSSISENVWIQLYEAKCLDLGIPYKADI